MAFHDCEQSEPDAASFVSGDCLVGRRCISSDGGLVEQTAGLVSLSPYRRHVNCHSETIGGGAVTLRAGGERPAAQEFATTGVGRVEVCGVAIGATTRECSRTRQLGGRDAGC